MNFQDYAPLALRTVKPMDREPQIKHALLGMITELGELSDNVKRNFVYGKDLDLVNGKEEIGDFCWYLNLYCQENYIAPKMLSDLMQIDLVKSPTAGESRVDTMIMIGGLLGGLCLPENERGGVSNMQLIRTLVMALRVACYEFGVTMEECLDSNIEKLAKRYGDKYSDYRALNRDLGAERKTLEG